MAKNMKSPYKQRPWFYHLEIVYLQKMEILKDHSIDLRFLQLLELLLAKIFLLVIQLFFHFSNLIQ